MSKRNYHAQLRAENARWHAEQVERRARAQANVELQRQAVDGFSPIKLTSYVDELGALDARGR